MAVDADSGLAQTARGTSDRMADVIECNSVLLEQKTVVFADAGYLGADKRADAKAERAMACDHASEPAQKARRSKQSRRRTHGQNREVQG